MTQSVCIFDLAMAVTYGVMGFLLVRSNGKGCRFIAGYNMKDTKERESYDEPKMCRYFGKTILLWGAFFVLGAVVDFFWPGVGVALAFALFILAFAYHLAQCRPKVFDRRFKKDVQGGVIKEN